MICGSSYQKIKINVDDIGSKYAYFNAGASIDRGKKACSISHLANVGESGFMFF
ncbi:hypothetical protein GCM10007162_05840 [Ignatzschineria ureiclastica]|uniref:hypothetical protein n=1 Tax=Ignatzschineria ureiclastica TaxID=472582 RepID=UPI001300328F|nr:hypothetical protein [Ignatzschineria ureiclastica]GGZ93340.1 hypothetical protein GCM10007162_05840 [Ignatzschineria ureiclastica]